MLSEVALAQSGVRIFTILKATQDFGLAVSHQVLRGAAPLKRAAIKLVGRRLITARIQVFACGSQASCGLQRRIALATKAEQQVVRLAAAGLCIAFNRFV